MKTLFALMLALSFSSAFAGESMGASCSKQSDSRAPKSINLEAPTPSTKKAVNKD